MVSGTTAMLARAADMLAASWISSAVGRLSAGWALSMARDEVNSNMPPPTWKLASEMPKKDRICRPSKALTAITRKALKLEIRIVRRRCSRVKPRV